MDLYLFYNCFCNLNDIFNKDEDELTLVDQKIFNNPLVLYNYQNESYNQYESCNQYGGALKLANKGAIY